MSGAKLSALVIASVLALAAACGGKKDKPPVTPDETASKGDDGGTDMPSSSGGSGDSDGGGGDKTAGGDVTAPPAKAPITVAAMKFTAAKGKKPKAIEVKGDGSVTADGKAAGKVAGDHIEDAAGKTLVSVSNDGAITGDSVKAGLKFAGDDVVDDSGAKIVTVGDDGTVTIASGKKSDAVGKWDNASASKREAAVVAVAWQMPPAAAAPAKPAGKPKPGPKK
jgi:hypothetical protein